MGSETGLARTRERAAKPRGAELARRLKNLAGCSFNVQPANLHKTLIKKSIYLSNIVDSDVS